MRSEWGGIMYDYISIHFDDYTKQIKSEVLEYY